MKTIAISEFKAHAFEVLGQVAETKEPVLITKRGKPLAEVVPFRGPDETPILGRLAGTLVIKGDIVAPIDETWNACK